MKTSEVLLWPQLSNFETLSLNEAHGAYETFHLKVLSSEDDFVSRVRRLRSENYKSESGVLLRPGSGDWISRGLKTLQGKMSELISAPDS